MSLIRPSDPLLPPEDPARSDRRIVGVTGVVSAAILWVLQTYVWHATVPTEIAALVYTAVPYVLSQLTGHLARYRRLSRAAQPPVTFGSTEVTGGPPAAGTGPAGPVPPTTP